MFPIAELTDADVVFPADVLKIMPKYEDIPKEFRNLNNHTKWNKLVSDWFFLGLKKLEIKPKEGVDQKKAMRHLGAIMRSFQPKHEHKEAAVAFLMSEWFEDATWKANSR